MAGLIKPGDYVDIIITVAADKEDTISNMIFQNVLVLATDKNMNYASQDNGKNKEEKTTTLTVAVTPDDATKLARAQAKGKVVFALRPYSAFSSGFTLVEAKIMGSLTGAVPVYSAPVSTTTVSITTPVQATASTQAPIENQRVQEPESWSSFPVKAVG